MSHEHQHCRCALPAGYVEWEFVGGPACGQFVAQRFGVARFEITRAPRFVGFDKDGEKHFQIPRGVYAAETARDVANHVLKWQGWNT